jgi:hypothetical protein
MPSQRDLSFLLDGLCSSLGLCLAPERRDALLAAAPPNAAAFVEAVVRAEGLDPQAMDQHLLRQIDTRVAAAFGRHHDHDA